MVGRPTRYEVLLTEGAEQDLEALYDYIAEFDSVANANHVRISAHRRRPFQAIADAVSG